MPAIFDRVAETTTTTGTGALALGGAITGLRPWSEVNSNGVQSYYLVRGTGALAGEWEVGIGTPTTGTPWTISRDTVIASSNAGALVNFSAGTKEVWNIIPAQALMNEVLYLAVSDEVTAITTGTAKLTFRMPFAMTLTEIPRASLTAASTSGTPTVDINDGGVSILSTKLTIDANEKTSTTAATAAVLSDAALANDAEITIDIDVAGTGAKGLKVMLIGRRT